MATATTVKYRIHLRQPHPAQARILESKAKRKVVRAGRRGGKTTGVAITAAQYFLDQKHVLYATPTADQIDRFWAEIKMAFREPLDDGVLYKNESRHIIEVPNTEIRIRAKTAWNADTLRGDYADLLILDEWQLMDEDAWGFVGAPMLLDNNGDAMFIYTPPSLHSRSVSKARDPRHAAKMYQRALQDQTGRWQAFHFTSHDNPYISEEALEELTADMSSLAYRQEIGAEDIDEAPGALWKRSWIDAARLATAPDLQRIVVAIDPAVSSAETSDETGIMVVGTGWCNCKGTPEKHGFVLKDGSGRYSPAGWANRAIALSGYFSADRIIGEVNNGGEMVEYTLRTINKTIPYKAVHASRAKQTRAEPIAALYEHGKVHHIGDFPEMEDQLCTWDPLSNQRSPDRLDAAVWALSELMITGGEPNIRWLS